MNRRQRRILRQSLDQNHSSLPLTLAFWSLWAALMYRLIFGF